MANYLPSVSVVLKAADLSQLKYFPDTETRGGLATQPKMEEVDAHLLTSFKI